MGIVVRTHQNLLYLGYSVQDLKEFGNCFLKSLTPLIIRQQKTQTILLRTFSMRDPLYKAEGRNSDMAASMNMEEQYDQIYRYCYFRLHSRETAEDLTQETFLRYFAKYSHTTNEQTLKYLYTIARNLCIDEYRRPKPEPLDESVPEASGIQLMEEQLLTGVAVRSALSNLEPEEQELLLLRYVNEVPVSVIGQLLGVSRFTVRRRLLSASRKFRENLRKEDF